VKRRWIPWVAGAGAAAAGLVGAVAVARAATRPDCSVASVGEGVLEGVPYLERMRGDAAQGDRVPMVVLLHAKDGTPGGYASGMGGIGPARLVLPQGGYDSPQGGYRWFPKGLLATLDDGVTPAEIDEWVRAADRLERFVRAMAACRPTAGKPILTGSSQGGEAALVVSTLHRRSIAGVVAVNADMPAALWDGKMAPTVMLHGTGDTTVPFAQAQENAAYAAERGAQIRFVPYPSPGHELTAAQTKAWRAEVAAFVQQQSTR
jgi:phospholipase/carboxylesterase